MVQADGDQSHREVRRGFRWSVPARFNIGVACCDDLPPSDTALVDLSSTNGVSTYSFGDLRRLSNRLANGLHGAGVRAGDRVGIVVPQSAATAIAHLAVYKLGAIALPLSTLFGPDALRFRLADAGARAVVVDRDALAKVEAVAAELPELETVLVAERDTASDRRIRGLWDVIDDADESYTPVETSADDPALLIYTSGTTGPPKGALHAQRVLLGHLPGFELSHDLFPHDGDRFWTPADWAWIGGLMDALLPSWYHGVPVVAATRKGFDPEWALDLIREHGIRNCFLPPTALKLMRQAGVSPGSQRLRSIVSGGEILGEEVLRWAADTLGVTVNEIYGQTEANYLVGNCSAIWDVRAGSMGLPYPGHDVEIVDADGERTRDGEPGQVAVRAPDPVMFLRYWNRPDATRDKFLREWLLTGDIAVRDGDGYLWFQARNDDVINSAGYRIGPGEIEECLIRHEAVAMAAVIGVPDEVRGEAVKAFIVLRPGSDASPGLEEDIRRHVRGRLAAYEYPRHIEFVGELPMTTTGKIQRAELRRREGQRIESRHD